jgi:hypothetical protein
MNVSRKLASLMAVAVWCMALIIPALMSAPALDDPLAPIGPLAGFEIQPTPEQVLPSALQQQASAALSELQVAAAARAQ